MSARGLLPVGFAFLVALLPAYTQIQFQVVEREVVEQRLQGYKGNDSQREETLKSMFESAGCRGDKLTEQAVKGLKQPNLICVLSGNADSVVACRCAL